MTIWKIEGREAACEIFTARGSKGGKRNPKLRYFLQLIPRQGEQRIQIRISKEDADHCMALRTKVEQIDWCAEKIAQASDSSRLIEGILTVSKYFEPTVHTIVIMPCPPPLREEKWDTFKLSR